MTDNRTSKKVCIGTFLARAAEKNPEKTYLLYQGTSLDYAGFVEMVARAARGFSELGIGRGNRVCLVLGNDPETLAAWLGLAQIGAIAVFANPSLTQREIQYIASHSEAEGLVISSDNLDTAEVLRSSLSSLKFPTIVAGEKELTDAVSFREILQNAPPLRELPPVSGDDVATFIFTSGTTGPPKAVMQTHRTYVLTGEAFSQWLGLTGEDRLFTCLPLHHINSQAYSVMGSLAAGAGLILEKKFSGTSFWEKIAQYRATEANLIGAMALMLLKQPPRPEERSHALRLVYSAPALKRQAHEEFEKRFGTTLVIGYGMSEDTFGTINPADKSKRQLESMGLPRFHEGFKRECFLKLVDEDGNEVGEGERGEIVLRNPTTMKGYYNDPEATRKVLRNGWLFTGDLAYRNRDGYLYFSGRTKDMIRLKGENVSAYEVESVINEHPCVSESAVVGIPTELGDEQIKAFIVLQSGGNKLSREEILEWCRRSLAPFKVPTLVEFRDFLPKTPTQKTAKDLLRKETISKEAFTD